jgi:hypothetical protein
MSATQAGELMERRLHQNVTKIRALAHVTKDGTKNLTNASAVASSHSIAAKIKKESHSGSLDTPCSEPGTLHVDLKQFPFSIGGYRYVAFFIDEHTRYVFFRLLKTKAEIVQATQTVVAEFNATAAPRVDGDGTVLERPRVRRIHSDHEGGYESARFERFRG